MKTHSPRVTTFTPQFCNIGGNISDEDVGGKHLPNSVPTDVRKLFI